GGRPAADGLDGSETAPAQGRAGQHLVLQAGPLGQADGLGGQGGRVDPAGRLVDQGAGQPGAAGGDLGPAQHRSGRGQGALAVDQQGGRLQGRVGGRLVPGEPVGGQGGALGHGGQGAGVGGVRGAAGAGEGHGQGGRPAGGGHGHRGRPAQGLGGPALVGADPDQQHRRGGQGAVGGHDHGVVQGPREPAGPA